MSVQVPEGQEPEAIELPSSGDAAFGALMDALAPEEAGEGEGQGGEPAAPAAAGDGQAAAPAEGAGAAGGQPAAPAAGAAGESGVPTAGTPEAGAAAPADAGADAGAGVHDAGGGEGARPAAWTASVTDVAPKFGELSTAFEEKVLEANRRVAFEEVQKEHPKYFEALNVHPRMLVGQQVPRIDGQEGFELIKDSADAKEWQDATKSLLIQEINARTEKAIDDQADYLETIHSSIKLFQDNNDLVPGTKEFDVDLANRFAAVAKPYELRVEGKLNGYSIPVQPLIDQLRAQVSAERAAKTAAGAPAASTPATGGTPAAPAGGGTEASSPAAEPPQAGIPNKAGQGGEAESYDTLFGTISPELRGLRF